MTVLFWVSAAVMLLGFVCILFSSERYDFRWKVGLMIALLGIAGNGYYLCSTQGSLGLLEEGGLGIVVFAISLLIWTFVFARDISRLTVSTLTKGREL